MKTFILLLAAASVQALYADSFLIEMEKIKSVSILTEPVRGKCALAADSEGRARWQIFSPYESITISNERGLFQFEKNAGEWKTIKNPFADKIKKVIGDIKNIVSGKFSNEYEVERSGNSATLLPKDPAARKFISKITVKFAGGSDIPESIEIEEAGGDKTVLKTLRAQKDPAGLSDAFDEKKFLKFPPK